MDVLEEYECLYPEKLNMRQAARNLNRAAVEPEKIIVKTSRKGGGSVVRTQAASPATSTVQPKALPQSPAEQTILMLLSQGSLHIDDIVKAANLPLGEVFAALTALEINGLARQLPGRLYESKLL
jgi:predicted Rossmann fold nucleotide-binding protein DprA/Smf involved in DNA uptake